MSEINETQQQVNAGNNNPPGMVSQVASTSNAGKIAGWIFLGIIAILMLFWTFHSSNNSHRKEQESAANDTPDYNQGTDTTTGAARTTNNNMIVKIEAERRQIELAKLQGEIKIYRMRQASAIEMYAGAPRAVSSGASVTAESSISGMPGSNLPLSNTEVNRLKNMLGSNDSDTNTAFQQRASNTGVETAAATRIAHTDFTVTQGTLISGALQTAINSDLPGMVKANVSEDVYATSGERVLIPAGSTLIGKYSAGISMGQERVFVVWTRLIRPDGIDIMLGSPGTDSLGQAGLGADNLDTHFIQRFGEASLLSIIGAGAATAGVSSGDQFNSAAAYRAGIANSFQQSAAASLGNSINIKPTIHVWQGARISVFVNRDLSFYNALANV